MKIETPLHADHQLDQLAGQFEHWRQTRAASLANAFPKRSGIKPWPWPGLAALQPRGPAVAVVAQ